MNPNEFVFWLKGVLLAPRSERKAVSLDILDEIGAKLDNVEIKPEPRKNDSTSLLSKQLSDLVGPIHDV